MQKTYRTGQVVPGPDTTMATCSRLTASAGARLSGAY